MANLTAAARKNLPSKAFAGPDRSYPIHDENHARAALSDVGRSHNPKLIARIRAAVHRKYPHLAGPQPVHGSPYEEQVKAAQSKRIHK